MKLLLNLSFAFYFLIGLALLDCALGQFKLIQEGADPLVKASYYRTRLPLSQIDINWYDGGTHAVVFWHEKVIYQAKS